MLLILLPLGIYVEWLRKFSFSSRALYSRRYLKCAEIEVIEYYVDRLFAGILWWFLRFIQTAFPELVLWRGEDEILESFCRYWCGTGKAVGVSAFHETVRRHWCGPKVGTQKENTEHGLEVRKIY